MSGILMRLPNPTNQQEVAGLTEIIDQLVDLTTFDFKLIEIAISDIKLLWFLNS